MAIVPDLSGVRPGRPGNIPLSDPHNPSRLEYAKKRDVGFANEPGVSPDAGQVFAAYTFTGRTVIIPEECAATFTSVAASTIVFVFMLNDDPIGTMTILAGTDIPIFGFTTLVGYYGDRFYMVAPDPADANLSGVSVSVATQRYGET